MRDFYLDIYYCVKLFIMVSGCHLLVSDYRCEEWHSLKALSYP